MDIEEKEVNDAVSKWLEGQGFRVFHEFLIDETGRPAAKNRPDLPDVEKRVLGWVRAYPNGVRLEEVASGLSGVVAPNLVSAAADRLVESGELVRKGDRVLLGPVVRGDSLLLPCPIRPDVYAFRGTEKVERWLVEGKGTRGDLVHGIGQAHLYAKVGDRAFLAIPEDWPPLYSEAAKEPFWAALQRTAKDLGFEVLRVGADGSVAKA